MFRSRKNTVQIPKKKYIIFNSNESSTDECSNQKNSIYKIGKKQSSNIEILKNIITSQDISGILNSDKRKLDIKDDSFIKEIINSDDDNISRTKEKFISLINNKKDDKVNSSSNKMKTVHNQLMSKNFIKRNYNNKNNSFINNLLKKNIMKKSKRKNLNNLNKLKLKDDGYINQFFTPKNKNKHLNKLFLDTIGLDYNPDKTYYKNISFSHYKFQDKNELKQKKIEKIKQLMNDTNPPSININSIKTVKNNYESSLPNKIFEKERNKRVYTLQNNFRLSFTNKQSTKNKKTLVLKFYNNKQRTFNKLQDYENKDNEIFYNQENKINSVENTSKYKSSSKDHFFRKNHKDDNNNFNISKDFSVKKKINRNHAIKIDKKRQNTFDSSLRLISNDLDKNDDINIKAQKVKENSYKTKLNNIQKRMSSLIGNLIDYIEILKKEK